MPLFTTINDPTTGAVVSGKVSDVIQFISIIKQLNNLITRYMDAKTFQERRMLVMEINKTLGLLKKTYEKIQIIEKEEAIKQLVNKATEIIMAFGLGLPLPPAPVED